MELVLVTNILIVFFAFLESKNIFKHGLFISFLIIFLFLSFRYNYGNDYIGYYKGFQEINRYVEFDIFDKQIHFEPGWVVLCILFKPVGFFGMVGFLSFLYCYLFYDLIKKYVSKKQYWLAVFILVFSSNFLLTHLSTMRQTLAILTFIFSLNFIFNKNIILYTAFILLASTFHSSALLLLPVYFLQFVIFKLNKFSIGIIFILYIFLFVFGENIKPFLNSLVTSFNEDYLLYDKEGEINSGIGLFIISFFFLTLLLNHKFFKGEINLLYKLVVLSFIIVPFGLVIMMISRIGMYFSVFSIIVYPLVFEEVKIKSIKYMFLILLLFLTFKSFIDLFEDPIYKEKYKEYYSIFSVN
jgi:hypothetical protein